MSIRWSQLTVDTITNLFLYGQMTRPVSYDDRIRNSIPSDKFGATIAIDGDTYMQSGPGRYALDLLSKLKLFGEFFAEASTYSGPAQMLSLAQYAASKGYGERELYKAPGGAKAILSLNHNFMDQISADYLDRAWTWGTSAFKLTDATFVFDGTSSRVESITLKPLDDNFDLSSSNPITQAVDQFILRREMGTHTIFPREMGTHTIFPGGGLAPVRGNFLRPGYPRVLPHA